jgi:hypothetical protein
MPAAPVGAESAGINPVIESAPTPCGGVVELPSAPATPESSFGTHLSPTCIVVNGQTSSQLTKHEQSSTRDNPARHCEVNIPLHVM